MQVVGSSYWVGLLLELLLAETARAEYCYVGHVGGFGVMFECLFACHVVDRLRANDGMVVFLSGKFETGC